MLRSLCVSCGCFADRDDGICRHCAEELPRLGPACQACALPLPTGAPYCGRCARGRLPVIRSHCLFEYQAPIDQLITRFKFRADLTVGQYLGRWLAQELRIADMPDAIVPVPLHRRRLRQRGFNQALELIKPLATARGIPIRLDVVERRIDTPDQIGLSALQRRRNMRQAFACTSQALPRHIALFDDVITTGATVLTLARCLRAAGVERVDVWALARATGSITRQRR